jgi:hypothetical protein
MEWTRKDIHISAGHFSDGTYREYSQEQNVVFHGGRSLFVAARHAGVSWLATWGMVTPRCQ